MKQPNHAQIWILKLPPLQIAKSYIIFRRSFLASGEFCCLLITKMSAIASLDMWLSKKLITKARMHMLVCAFVVLTPPPHDRLFRVDAIFVCEQSFLSGSFACCIGFSEPALLTYFM